MINVDSPLIVHSDNANAFYRDLARRLAVACGESGREATLCTARELSDMPPESLREALVAVVNPFECSHWLVDKGKFIHRLRATGKKLMVLAEALETRWFEHQLKVPVHFDALVDVGFVPQESRARRHSDMPYRFLFHGMTQPEKEKLREPSSQRSIPWALIGLKTTNRLKLAEGLMARLGTNGFVFLPDPGLGVRQRGESIGPTGMHKVLSATQYYVWVSHHEFPYYESFRFREALLAGAVPCKVEPQVGRWDDSGIPNIFPSLEVFAKVIRQEGYENMVEAAREYYLSHNLLATDLDRVLKNV